MSVSGTRADVVRFSVDRGLLRGLGVAPAGGVPLALTEALGMSGTSLLFRLAYWLPIMLLGSCGGICARCGSSGMSTWTGGRCWPSWP